MFCSNCGFQNNNGSKFCNNCGTLLNNIQPQQTVQQQNNNINGVIQTNYQQPMNQNQIPNQSYQVEYQNVNSNYINQAINPDMKKWAILSIIIPIAGMIFYWFIGLSVYLALVIAACGFEFAKKGEMADKNLAKIGKVLNSLLCIMALIVLIIQFFGIFTA